ncbi:uncharacterized protein LOC126324061 [Schistocerca gregaria]|uniref:uncharacterized protein LOC126324061 n=1 Tax=Schistocerca gregaria TaxID=7010 RepID=UPI00211E2367|nr:uncharacterized protein LOC126324061 [Schistocerca gregaria]
MLSVSLDDVVRQNRKEIRKQRGSVRHRRAYRRFYPYNRRERQSSADDGARWENDKFEAHERGVQLSRSLRRAREERSYKVRVQGVADGVTMEELEELFSAVGTIKHIRTHRRTGAVIIYFDTKKAALNAVELYNGKSLDESSSMTLKVDYIPYLGSASGGPSSSRGLFKNFYEEDSVRNITVTVL